MEKKQNVMVVIVVFLNIVLPMCAYLPIFLPIFSKHVSFVELVLHAQFTQSNQIIGGTER